MMSEILLDLSPSALVTAIEANRFEVFCLFRHWPQAEVHDGPDMLCTITDIPYSHFNNVFRAQLAPDNIDAAIQSTIAQGRSRNVDRLWSVGPSTRPTNLWEYLEAHGYRKVGISRGMAADLLALNENLPAAPGLTIEQVSDDETLVQWCHMLGVGFEWADSAEDAWLDFNRSVGLGAQLPFRHYLGRLEGEPVATSSLFLGAGVAGIYDVVTLPGARRQGIGAAMTVAPLRQARALGYRVGVLQSSEMGFSVYQKVGFREYCKISMYVWAYGTEQSGETTAAA